MNRCNYSKGTPPAERHINTWLDLLDGHMNESGMTKEVLKCKHNLNEAIFTSKAAFSILRNCSTATKRMLGRLSREVPLTKRKILDRAGWVCYKRVWVKNVKHRCTKIQKQIQPSNWLLCRSFNSSWQLEWLNGQERLRVDQGFKLGPEMKLQVCKRQVGSNMCNNLQHMWLWSWISQQLVMLSKRSCWAKKNDSLSKI